jgi:molybdopterin-binding protein
MAYPDSPAAFEPTMSLQQKGTSMQLSARNKLSATVTKITRGEAIANVELDVNGQRVVASITVEAVEELRLREGTDCWAVVKASDVMVGIPHD